MRRGTLRLFHRDKARRFTGPRSSVTSLPVPGEPLRRRLGLQAHSKVELLKRREASDRRSELAARQPVSAIRRAQLQIKRTQQLGNPRTACSTSVPQTLQLIPQPWIKPVHEADAHLPPQAVRADHGPDLSADDRSVAPRSTMQHPFLDHAPSVVHGGVVVHPGGA